MRRGDIPTGCATNPDDRKRVVVAVEPRAYRTAIGSAIQALRPHREVTVVEPDELQAEMARFSIEESRVRLKVRRELAKRPPPQMLLPSMGFTGRGLVASWRAGAKTMESRSLLILAYDRVLQGRLHEGIRVAREALGISRELPAGAEALALAVLGIGLVEIGEYEEALE